MNESIEPSREGIAQTEVESEFEELDVEVLHAGTAEVDGRIVTAGGRVLNVTGFGATPAEARDRAYAAAERIQFDGKQMRTDIAARAVDRVEA